MKHRVTLATGVAIALVAVIGLSRASHRPGMRSIALRAQSTSCGNGSVESGEQCDGGRCCDGNCRFHAPGFPCRGLDGTCDVIEACTGNSADCPADAFLSATTLCRDAAGACDVPENCPGNAAECPKDVLKAVYIPCRDGAGVCDTVEYCSGSDSACPLDTFVPPSRICAAATGICPAIHCSGKAAACPAVACDGNTRPTIAAIADRADRPLQPVFIPLKVNDADKDPLTLAADGLPPGISLKGRNLEGALRGDAAFPSDAQAPQDGRIYTPTITVTDAHGGTGSATFIWTIKPLVAHVTLRAVCACADGIGRCAQQVINEGPDAAPLIEVRAAYRNAEYLGDAQIPTTYSYLPVSATPVGTGGVIASDSEAMWRSATPVPPGTAFGSWPFLRTGSGGGSATIEVRTPYSIMDAPLPRQEAALPSQCSREAVSPGDVACEDDYLLYVLAVGERGGESVDLAEALDPCLDPDTITSMVPPECAVSDHQISCAAQTVSFLIKPRATCPVGTIMRNAGAVSFADASTQNIDAPGVRFCPCANKNCPLAAASSSSSVASSSSAQSLSLADVRSSSVSSVSLVETPLRCLSQRRLASALMQGLTPLACVDSDGGFDPLSQGIVRQGGKMYIDSCDGERVVENVCLYYERGGEGTASDAVRLRLTRACDCGMVCQGGACVPSSASAEDTVPGTRPVLEIATERCRDVDGFDARQASRTVIGEPANFSYADSCADEASVWEFTCADAGGGARNMTLHRVPCAGGRCKDGACVTPDAAPVDR